MLDQVMNVTVFFMYFLLLGYFFQFFFPSSVDRETLQEILPL